MEKSEVLFSYCNERCHAKIVDKLQGNERFIGNINGYEIYSIYEKFFNQLGFVAIKPERQKVTAMKFYQFAKYKNGAKFIKEFENIEAAIAFAETHDCILLQELN